MVHIHHDDTYHNGTMYHCDAITMVYMKPVPIAALCHCGASIPKSIPKLSLIIPANRATTRAIAQNI